MACASWAVRVCWTRWAAWLLEFLPLRSSGDVWSPRSLLGGEGDNDAIGEVCEKTAHPPPPTHTHVKPRESDAWICSSFLAPR